MYCRSLSASPPPLSKGQKKGGATASEQLEDPPIFGKPFISRGGRRRGGVKWTKAKKAKKRPSTEGANVEDWFEDIGLEDEELTTEGPPRRIKDQVRSEDHLQVS